MSRKRKRTRIPSLLIAKGVHTRGVHYRRFKPKNSRLLSQILLCHLVIENHLIRFLETYTKGKLNWDESEIRFSQVVRLLDSNTGPFQGTFAIEGLKRLNKIRNEFAHNIEAQLTNFDVEPLQKLKLGKDPSGLPKDLSPIEVIEIFCGGICAYVAGYCTGFAEVKKLPVVYPKKRSKKIAKHAI